MGACRTLGPMVEGNELRFRELSNKCPLASLVCEKRLTLDMSILLRLVLTQRVTREQLKN